jgi:hypothetical protein
MIMMIIIVINRLIVMGSQASGGVHPSTDDHGEEGATLFWGDVAATPLRKAR